MSSQTSRLSLPFPLDTDLAIPPSDFKKLANALDGVITGYFASNAASPPTPYTGLLWYQVDTGKLAYYSGTAWVYIPSIIASSSAPTSGAINSLWFQTTTNALFINTGSLGTPTWTPLIAAPGASGTILTSTGTTTAPQWQTPSIPATQIAGTGSSAGQFLVSNGSGSAPTWQTTPAARMHRSLATFAVGGGSTKIPLGAADYNVGGGTANTTLYRYIVPNAGYFQVNGRVHLTSLGSTFWGFVSIYKNGTEYARGQDIKYNPLDATNDEIGLVVNDIVKCTANTDYIELYVYTYAAVTNVPGVALTYMSISQASQ